MMNCYKIKLTLLFFCFFSILKAQTTFVYEPKKPGAAVNILDIWENPSFSGYSLCVGAVEQGKIQTIIQDIDLNGKLVKETLLDFYGKSDIGIFKVFPTKTGYYLQGIRRGGINDSVFVVSVFTDKNYFVETLSELYIGKFEKIYTPKIYEGKTGYYFLMATKVNLWDNDYDNFLGRLDFDGSNFLINKVVSQNFAYSDVVQDNNRYIVIGKSPNFLILNQDFEFLNQKSIFGTNDLTTLIKHEHRLFTLGRYSTTDTTTWVTKSKEDLGVAKFSTKLGLLKQVNIGKKKGPTNDTLDYPSYQGLRFNSKGDLFVLGATFKSDQDFNNNPREADSWITVAKLDSSLNTIWVKYLFGDTNYFSTGIVPTSDGGVLIRAYKLDKQTNTQVIIVLKLSPDGTLLSDEAQVTDEPIQIGPNPCKDVLHLNIESLGNTLYIYDILGRLERQFELTEGHNSLSINDLENGNHIYTIQKGQKIIAKGKLSKL